MWIIPPVGLSELVPAPVFWVDDIGAIALENGVMTAYYYALHQPLNGQAPQRAVELVVKRPAHRLITTFGAMARVLEAYCGAGPHDTMPPTAPTRPPGFRPRIVSLD